MPKSSSSARFTRMAMLSAIFLMAHGPAAFAQHGKSQKAGVYTFPYKGDTWTGEIVSFDRADREITLQVKKQTETFTAKILTGAKAYVKDHPEESISALDVGDRIIAYYIAPGQKYVANDESGKRKEVAATENLVFEIEVFAPKKTKK